MAAAAAARESVEDGQPDVSHMAESEAICAERAASKIRHLVVVVHLNASSANMSICTTSVAFYHATQMCKDLLCALDDEPLARSMGKEQQQDGVHGVQRHVMISMLAAVTTARRSTRPLHHIADACNIRIVPILESQSVRIPVFDPEKGSSSHDTSSASLPSDLAAVASKCMLNSVLPVLIDLLNSSNAREAEGAGKEGADKEGADGDDASISVLDEAVTNDMGSSFDALAEITRLGLFHFGRANGTFADDTDSGRHSHEGTSRDLVLLTDATTQSSPVQLSRIIHEVKICGVRISAVLFGDAGFPYLREYSGISSLCQSTGGTVFGDENLARIFRQLWCTTISHDEGTEVAGAAFLSCESHLWWPSRSLFRPTLRMIAHEANEDAGVSNSGPRLSGSSYEFPVAGRPILKSLTECVVQKYVVSEKSSHLVVSNRLMHGFRKRSASLLPGDVTFDAELFLYPDVQLRFRLRSIQFATENARSNSTSGMLEASIAVVAQPVFLQSLHALMFKATTLGVRNSSVGSSSVVCVVRQLIFEMRRRDVFFNQIGNMDFEFVSRSELAQLFFGSCGFDCGDLPMLFHVRSLYTLNLECRNWIHISIHFRSKGGGKVRVVRLSDNCFIVLSLNDPDRSFWMVGEQRISSCANSVVFAFSSQDTPFINQVMRKVKQALSRFLLNTSNYPPSLLWPTRMDSTRLIRFSPILSWRLFERRTRVCSLRDPDVLFAAFTETRARDGLTFIERKSDSTLCCVDPCAENSELAVEQALVYHAAVIERAVLITISYHHPSKEIDESKEAAMLANLSRLQEIEVADDMLVKAFDAFEDLSRVRQLRSQFNFCAPSMWTHWEWIFARSTPRVYVDLPLLDNTELDDQVLAELHRVLRDIGEAYIAEHDLVMVCDTMYVKLCPDGRHFFVVLPKSEHIWMKHLGEDAKERDLIHQGGRKPAPERWISVEVVLFRRPRFWPAQNQVLLSDSEVSPSMRLEMDAFTQSIRKAHQENICRIVASEIVLTDNVEVISARSVQMALGACRISTISLMKLPLPETRTETATKAVHARVAASRSFRSFPWSDSFFCIRPLSQLVRVPSQRQQQLSDWLISPCFAELRPGFQLYIYSLDTKRDLSSSASASLGVLVQETSGGSGGVASMLPVRSFQRPMISDLCLLATSAIDEVCVIAARRCVVSLISDEYGLPALFRSMVLDYFLLHGLVKRDALPRSASIESGSPSLSKVRGFGLEQHDSEDPVEAFTPPASLGRSVSFGMSATFSVPEHLDRGFHMEFVDDIFSSPELRLRVEIRQFPPDGGNFSISVERSNVNVFQQAEFSDVEIRRRPSLRVLLDFESFSYAAQVSILYHLIFDTRGVLNVSANEQEQQNGHVVMPPASREQQPSQPLSHQQQQQQQQFFASSKGDCLVRLGFRYSENPPLRTDAFVDIYTLTLALEGFGRMSQQIRKRAGPSASRDGTVKVDLSAFEHDFRMLFPGAFNCSAIEMVVLMTTCLKRIRSLHNMRFLQGADTCSGYFAIRIDGGATSVESKPSAEAAEYALLQLIPNAQEQRMQLRIVCAFAPYAGSCMAQEANTALRVLENKSDAAWSVALSLRTSHRHSLQVVCEERFRVILHEGLELAACMVLWENAFLGPHTHDTSSYASRQRDTAAAERNCSVQALLNSMGVWISRTAFDARRFPALDFCEYEVGASEFLTWLNAERSSGFFTMPLGLDAHGEAFVVPCKKELARAAVIHISWSVAEPLQPWTLELWRTDGGSARNEAERSGGLIIICEFVNNLLLFMSEWNSATLSTVIQDSKKT